MVNFRDPIIAGKYYLVLKSLYHTTGGIFLWEYFTTLDYEFDIIRGRRPYRWTTWIYSFTRATTLVAVILNFFDLNTTTPINCQVWITSEAIFGYLGLAAASLLVVLRVIAIWNRNKTAVAIVTGLWVTYVVAMIQGISRLRSDWIDYLPGCSASNSHSSELNIIYGLIADVVLLLTMLVGLLRLRSEGGGTFGIGGLLWKQGLIWLVVATVADVPPTVLIILNLNDPLNVMFQIPALVVMSIAATRMHRSLTDFASSITERNSNISNFQCIQTPFNRIQVTVNTPYEHDQMLPTSHHGPCISTEGQPCDKPPQFHEYDIDKERPFRTEPRIGTAV